jgi:hypothetical protein
MVVRRRHSSRLFDELLRETYLAADPLEARRLLGAFYEYCARSEVPELAAAAAVLGDIHPHQLRHTYATSLNGGMSLEALIAVLGSNT